ncbi:M13 family metallopeptidase [Caldiplasma sukawensis]
MDKLISKIYRIKDDEKPEDPAIKLEYMDTSVDPGQDFFRYACGKWLEKAKIPDEKLSWGATYELIEKNTFILGKILEECVENIGMQDEERDKLGKLYFSYMNEDEIERKKFRPIGGLIDMVKSADDLNKIRKLFPYFIMHGIKTFFSVSVDIDEKDSSRYQIHIYQSGLGLPNRDYYFNEEFSEIRQKYIEHIDKAFSIFASSNIKGRGERIFNMEKELAQYSKRPEELRDPEKNYNRFGKDDLKKYRNIDLFYILNEIHVWDYPYIIVGQPEFLEKLNEFLVEWSLDDIKEYLKYRILEFAGPFLHNEFYQEHFNFYMKELLGIQKPEKRWKRGVMLVDHLMGEALGKIYVQSYFPESSKQRVETMVRDIMDAFRERIKGLDWMSEETKRKALEKFETFRPKIGYPSKFKDYSSLYIDESDLIGNVSNCNYHEASIWLERVNEPVDHELWGMTPPTVNAYFSPTENEIVFPAGILQPPFFDPELDDSVNYGSTGGTIAHEISHGFDDEGRKFDKNGNIVDWWSREDEERFLEKAERVVKIYGSVEPIKGLKINGKLTLGENIADIGGVSIAFAALERKLKREGRENVKINGYTPQQLFFIGWAQSWRGKIRDEALRFQISNDPHSPDAVRGEIPALVHEKFDQVFPNSKNRIGEKISIW